MSEKPIVSVSLEDKELILSTIKLLFINYKENYGLENIKNFMAQEFRLMNKINSILMCYQYNIKLKIDADYPQNSDYKIQVSFLDINYNWRPVLIFQIYNDCLFDYFCEKYCDLICAMLEYDNKQ